MKPKILLIDDDLELCAILARQLRGRQFDVHMTGSLSEAVGTLDKTPFDAVITDVNMPDGNGIELASCVHSRWPELPVLVITSYGSMETAVATLRAGASDFITKPIELELLIISLNRALETRRLKNELASLKSMLSNADSPPGFIGESPKMKSLFSLVSKTAATDVTVLITGESGTGKEVVAQTIHQQSSRKGGPFVAINCTALPEQLLESELFGHVKGAFTDARDDHSGLLQRAHGGTLFLDEIGDMPVGLQGKLLRVLEQKTFRPVGAAREIAFDARIMSATNSDLAAAVAEKRFREDLYYRLNVLHIELPPLRERGRDVLLLAQFFVEQLGKRMGRDITGIHHDAAKKILTYPWPGNVRELKNCIERALALCESDQITTADLPARIVDSKEIHVVLSTENPSNLITLEELERNYIQKVLATLGGNKAQASKVLGIERKSLYRKLERMGKL
ncbi:MAG: sigma-54-dependent Fis family transcriptional regulator [Deltaproteobacteria bacterium]|nr:sigma-54-dependent Fis family transcriptional regulator [Deltaproteobacteria bacterium]